MRVSPSHIPLLCIVIAVLLSSAEAFQQPTTTTLFPCRNSVLSHESVRKKGVAFCRHGRFPNCATSPTTSLSMLGLSTFPVALSSKLSQLLAWALNWSSRRSLVMVAAAAFVCGWFMARKDNTSWLWPNSASDPNVSAPLPPGPSLGCPLLGRGFGSFFGSKRYGPGAFYFQMLQKFPQQKLLRFYAFGTNYIGLAGGQSPVQPVLRSEFEPDGITIGVTSSGILGRESLLMEPDKAKHARLRRLVGQAMTPAAVAESIPTLQDIASRQIRQRLDDAITVSADVLCTDFTLDVAWRQILGLDLRPEEVPVFSKAVDDWITGLLDFSSSILGVRLGFLPHWKALDYLRNKISDKIDELEQKGPDSSTISGMVFAVDDEVNGADVDTAAPKRKLTKDQIIDNVLILILAGSETSASTLAQAILALKLNPDSWNKLVDEQKAMMEKYGTEMTKQTLDDECPYLDSVIRETMRMMPLPTGAPRRVKRTQVIDGYQIPKGSKVMFSPLMTHYNDPTTYKEDGSHMDIQRGGFQPERWLKEETRPSSDFIPMGAGPRYCLGANLAYAEMKVFLATLARSADYSLKGSYEDGVVWKRASILPKPVDGVPIEMVKKPMAVASASA